MFEFVFKFYAVGALFVITSIIVSIVAVYCDEAKERARIKMQSRGGYDDAD